MAAGRGRQCSGSSTAPKGHSFDYCSKWYAIVLEVNILSQNWQSKIIDEIPSACIFTHLISATVRLSTCTTIKIYFKTDRSGETVSASTKERPGQGLHCLPFNLHLFKCIVKTHCSIFHNIKGDLGAQISKNIMIHYYSMDMMELTRT